MTKLQFRYTLPNGMMTERIVDFPHEEHLTTGNRDLIALAGMPEGTRINHVGAVPFQHSKPSSESSKSSNSLNNTESSSIDLGLAFWLLPLSPICLFNAVVQFVPVIGRPVSTISRCVLACMLTSGICTNLFNLQIPVVDTVSVAAWSIYYDSWHKTDKFLAPKIEASPNKLDDIVLVGAYVFGAGPSFLDGFHHGVYGSNSVKNK